MEEQQSMKNSSNAEKIKTNKYAPVVVFGYNRADMLKNLFDSLEKNEDVEKMDLYIFLDIPDKKNPRDVPLSKEVITYVNTYKETSKFRNVEIKIAKQHKGLADSIISGVTEIINQYGKVIVLEDDLEVSNDFLNYMQRGLKFYQNDFKIWSLSAYCYERMKFPLNYNKDVFLGARAESWGWATWADRWNRTDWHVKSYEKFKKDIVGKMIFNIGGKDLCKSLEAQMADKGYDSWAIRWSYQQFRERKYTVYPRESRVLHCGSDNRSTHTTYHSKTGLKQKYADCRFENLKPSVRIIWNFKKAVENMS